MESSLLICLHPSLPEDCIYCLAHFPSRDSKLGLPNPFMPMVHSTERGPTLS